MVNNQEVNQLLSEIKEYENQAEFARKTNERELPLLKQLVSSPDSFMFGEQDRDLTKRVLALAEKIKELDPANISAEVKKSLIRENREILQAFVIRYRERLEAYASRQGSL